MVPRMRNSPSASLKSALCSSAGMGQCPLSNQHTVHPGRSSTSFSAYAGWQIPSCTAAITQQRGPSCSPGGAPDG
eukprot:scaffold127806_cov66-Phaeocystis_antarctica.AAC.2